MSISPLHVLKGTLKDVLQWCLNAVYSALGSDAAWKAWLRRIDQAVVEELADFQVVKGRCVPSLATCHSLPVLATPLTLPPYRCKRKGLSGILLYSTSGPPQVKGGSKVGPPYLL